jgi:hypothetical protein
MQMEGEEEYSLKLVPKWSFRGDLYPRTLQIKVNITRLDSIMVVIIYYKIGGGIYCADSDFTINDIQFEDNEAPDGEFYCSDFPVNTICEVEGDNID